MRGADTGLALRHVPRNPEGSSATFGTEQRPMVPARSMIACSEIRTSGLAPEATRARRAVGSCARLLRKIQQLERELALARRCANYDSLTGLPN